MGEELKIRDRHRVGYIRDQGYGDWYEYQVVGARGKILGRFDLRSQAEEFIEERRRSHQVEG